MVIITLINLNRASTNHQVIGADILQSFSESLLLYFSERGIDTNGDTSDRPLALSLNKDIDLSVPRNRMVWFRTSNTWYDGVHWPVVYFSHLTSSFPLSVYGPALLTYSLHSVSSSAFWRASKKGARGSLRMPCTEISTFPDLLVQMPHPTHLPLHQQPQHGPIANLNLTYHLAQ